MIHLSLGLAQSGYGELLNHFQQPLFSRPKKNYTLLLRLACGTLMILKSVVSVVAGRTAMLKRLRSLQRKSRGCAQQGSAGEDVHMSTSPVFQLACSEVGAGRPAHIVQRMAQACLKEAGGANVSSSDLLATALMHVCEVAGPHASAAKALVGQQQGKSAPTARRCCIAKSSGAKMLLGCVTRVILLHSWIASFVQLCSFSGNLLQMQIDIRGAARGGCQGSQI